MNMITVDHSYMENHLIDYVLFQINQGYLERDIRKVLLHYGYPASIVQGVFSKVDIMVPQQSSFKEYDPAQLSKEMYEYLLNLLIDYIVKEHKQGYDIPTVRKALLRYGHNKKIIDAAIKAIKSGRVVSYQLPAPFQFPQNAVFAVCLVLLFAFVVFLSISSNSSMIVVLLSFAPALLSFVAMHFVLGVLMHRRLITFIPLLSILVSVGLFIGSVKLALFPYAQPQILLALNVVLGFVASVLLCLFSKKKEKILVEVENEEMRLESDAPLADLIREEIQRVDGDSHLVADETLKVVMPQKKKSLRKKEKKLPLRKLD